MSTTFLDLTNKLLLEMGEVQITETEFPSVRNVHATAKNAIVNAIDEINAREMEWPFNADVATQICVVGQELYSFPANTTVVDWESFRIQKDNVLNVHTTPLTFINKDRWYKYGRPADDDASPNGRRIPRFVFSTNPNGFGITPSPDSEYTILYNRFIEPSRLVLFDDTPTIPSRFDFVIIDFALKRMNRHKDNAEQTQLSDSQAEKSLSIMKTAIMNKQEKMEDTVVNYGDRRYTNGARYHE